MTTPMHTDDALLTLTQWLSPAFPTGAFAFSHGIETAIHEGWIADADGLETWLRDCLEHGSGRADAIWMRLTFEADDPTDIDTKLRAFTPSAERLREAERQGNAFVETVNAVWRLSVPDLLLPVAVAHAARLAGVDIDLAVRLYLQSFVSNLVSAAVRLSPIGQTAGQAVVYRLQGTCTTVERDTRGSGEDDLFSNTFLSDIAAMRHETQQPRLFQS